MNKRKSIATVRSQDDEAKDIEKKMKKGKNVEKLQVKLEKLNVKHAKLDEQQSKLDDKREKLLKKM